jgi:hypothetical protein
MNDDEKYGIGDAQQFFGNVAPWAQEFYSNEGRNYTTPITTDEGYYSNEGRNYTTPIITDEGYYSNEGRNYPTPESTQGPGGSPINASMATGLDRFLNALKGLGSKAGNFAQTPQGIMSLLAALAAYKDRARPSGGGTTMAYAGPKPVTRTMTQGKYGPIAQYAAQGGLMQAYAQGGHVKMEDGGFVLTKRAVDGAGGPKGLAALMPQARMIQGPGTGTSDSIPASIQGRSGVTPAKVSNGEAYVPRKAVEDAGGPEAMYALMHKLQRRA